MDTLQIKALITTAVNAGINAKLESLFPNIKLPQKIIFIRHGKSYQNEVTETETIKPAEVLKVSDVRCNLTDEGITQAKTAGTVIKTLCDGSKFFMYRSPYKRTRQTGDEIMNIIGKLTDDKIKEMPELREQEYGPFQSFKPNEVYDRENDKLAIEKLRY